MQFYRQDRWDQSQYPMARQSYRQPQMPQMPQMPQQQFGSPRNNAFSRGQDYASYPYPMDPRQGQMQTNPNPQMPVNRRNNLDLDTMMGHVGTITNGINAMRQLSSIFNLFK